MLPTAASSLPAALREFIDPSDRLPETECGGLIQIVLKPVGENLTHQPVATRALLNECLESTESAQLGIKLLPGR